MEHERKHDDVERREHRFPATLIALPVVALGLLFQWPDAPGVELAAQTATLLSCSVLLSFGLQILSGARALILDLWNIGAFVLLGAIFSYLFGWSATVGFLVAQAAWGSVGALRARSG